MFPSTPWISNVPVTNMPSSSDNPFQLPANFSNFSILPGPGTVPFGMFTNDPRKIVAVKNLPPKVTKEIIEELLYNTWPALKHNKSVLSVDLQEVIDGKASCKIEFDSEAHASLLGYFNTWYMRINQIQDASHESKISVEYLDPSVAEPEEVFPPLNEATVKKLEEDVSNESTLKEALRTLEHWMNTETVNRRIADIFINVLQKVYNQVHHLTDERLKCVNEVYKTKQELNDKVEGLASSLKDLVKALKCASKKRVWDHFTKAQRKNLDSWLEEAEKLQEANSSELMAQREEDEMDISDCENNSSDGSEDRISALKERLNAVLRQKAIAEAQADNFKREMEEKIAHNQSLLHDVLQDNIVWKRKIAGLKSKKGKGKVKNTTEETDSLAVSVSSSTTPQIDSVPLASPLNAELVSQLGHLRAFLNLHRNGANIEYITSYLRDSGEAVTSEYVESVLRRFPNLFVEETIGVGADLKNVWKYSKAEPPVDSDL